MSVGGLDGRVALVTGGGRGIGAAIVRELASHGATVAINCRARVEDARALATEVGRGARAWPADVSDPGQAERMVADVAAAHGAIEVAVLNAGIWRGGRIERLALEDWRAVTSTALDGAFAIARAVVPTMRERGFGRIVVIGSVIGLVGFAGHSAYATAKAGLLGLVRSLSKELGRDGITVNAVLPGLVETEMTAAIPRASRERMIARTSLGRPADAREVASAVRVLAAEGSYVTGHALVVDGGFSL
ncbi:MAG: SDR family oxidoreductase [Solirubrobacterales bacterium]|nr:SDR family oxidoreductase [Solirubrobacterales bacterium]